MKNFTYTYYFAPGEDLKLSLRQRKYINLNLDACYEIHLRMRPWIEERLVDTPKRLTGVFWTLKKEEETLTLRVVKRGLFSKKTEDMRISSFEELQDEIVKREGKNFVLLYELEGKLSKFVDFTDEHLVECYFHKSFIREVETVFQHFAEKIDGSNAEEAETMRLFMEDRVKEGMKLPELVAVFEEMAKNPLHCTEELLMVETGIYDFSGEDRYHFDLTRQIPTGQDDEYFQICMSIMFSLAELSILDILDDESEDLDSDCREPMEEFFTNVREMDIYRALCDKSFCPIEVKITVEET